MITPMWVYVCMYAYVYVYLYMCMYTCMYVCMYTCTRVISDQLARLLPGAVAPFLRNRVAELYDNTSDQEQEGQSRAVENRPGDLGYGVASIGMPRWYIDVSSNTARPREPTNRPRQGYGC